MLSSAQVGLRSVAADAWAVLLAVGDMPAIEVEVVAQLVTAYANLPESSELSGRYSDECVYIPSYRMQAGHPVLIPRPFWPAILALPAGANLRSVWRAEGARVQWVGVDTPSVLRDLDTPEDYEQELRLWR